eukprot:3343418-Prymnesium_polylepis.1
MADQAHARVSGLSLLGLRQRTLSPFYRVPTRLVPPPSYYFRPLNVSNLTRCLGANFANQGAQHHTQGTPARPVNTHEQGEAGALTLPWVLGPDA